jgi:hypothetical protein
MIGWVELGSALSQSDCDTMRQLAKRTDLGLARVEAHG